MPQSGAGRSYKKTHSGALKKCANAPPWDTKIPFLHSIFHFCRGPVRVNMTLKKQDKTMKGNDANETKGDVR